MNIESILSSIANQVPYSYLTDQQSKDWLEKAKIVKFKQGQTIYRPEEVYDSLYLILSGQVRLLAINPKDKQLITVAKRSQGQLLGWINIISGQAIEHVSASTEVLALKLSSIVFSQILQNNKQFLDNFAKLPSPLESAKILQFLIDSNIRKDDFIQEHFLSLCDQSIVKSFDSGEHFSDVASQSHGRLWFSSCCHSQLPFGQSISSDFVFPSNSTLLPFRLVGIVLDPKYLSSNLTSSVVDQVPHENPSNLAISDLNILSDDMPEVDDQFPVLVAKQSRDPIDAICEMICLNENVPYRRDIIVNVIKSKRKRNKDLSLNTIGSLLELLGFQVSLSTIDVKYIPSLPFPSVFYLSEDNPCIAYEFSNGVLEVVDPRFGKKSFTISELNELLGEELMIATPRRILTTPQQTFGWHWFIPLIKKYKLSLALVFVASLFAQLFGLAIPLLIQQIIDKVLTQGNLSSLNVLGFTMIVLAVFQGLLTALRTYIFVDTTDRIDMTLGTAVIARLLSLRLNFFDKRPVGELSQRLGELNNIRSFITGTALSSVLNIIFASMYLIVMILYSPLLTVVALSTIPIYILMIVVVSPVYRNLIRRRAAAQAQTQSHLIEVLSGIQTVKAQNFELTARWKWQERYQKFIDQGFRSVALGTTTGVIGGFLNTLSSLLILWVGMWLVLDGQLTLGMLIAFRIISGNVIGPITQLATLYQGYQKVQVSMERVSDIVDQQPEYNISTDDSFGQISLPPISGRVSFEDVTFSFDGVKKPALENVSLEIYPNQFVAIVGQSGSGKSTLTKLISRLYSPDRGRVYVDGYDIDKVDLSSLRSQIGIVPQDSLLFEGTISENIALNDPTAENEQIIEAAKIACAHDFIMDLEQGYATVLSERGANLSGGQRQRIAIARTLLSNPQLLIMDEATSALDYNTESILCANLRDWSNGKTVIFITHRLSSIKSSEKIILMHNGRIEEAGNHNELMTLSGRYYAMYTGQSNN